VIRGLPATVEVWAKVEWADPRASVRDRPAAAIITRPLQNGWLTSEKTLLESSSGNIGIAYAILCASLGLPVRLTVPANATPERLAILRALGMGLTLTDPPEGTGGPSLGSRF
jgi:cysteine synthase B